VELVPGAAFRAGGIAGVAFTFAFHLDACTFDQEVPLSLRSKVHNAGLQSRLAAAKGATCSTEPARDQTRSLHHQFARSTDAAAQDFRLRFGNDRRDICREKDPHCGK
jgi:hypothetical protein